MLVDLPREPFAGFVLEQLADAAFEMGGPALQPAFEHLACGRHDQAEDEEQENQPDGHFQRGGTEHGSPPFPPPDAGERAGPPSTTGKLYAHRAARGVTAVTLARKRSCETCMGPPGPFATRD